MTYSHATKSSTRDAEKILRSIMIADRTVLRRRESSQDRLSPEGREAIRAARQRQAARNHQLKSKTAVVPPTLNREGKRYG